jgi:4-carboxymuconolactone decarboxylase
MARIPDATRETFPEELKYVWDRTMTGPAGAANIFKAMGNNPQVLRGYLRCGNALWSDCGLDVATRELVILRCAYLQNSAYEWHQHVRIGRDAGLSDDQIRGIVDWKNCALFGPEVRALFQYADAMAVSDHPGAAVFNELAKHYPASTVVGVTILVAFYFATAKFLAAMEVQTEDAFVGWVV